MPVLTGESGTSVFRRSDSAAYAKCVTTPGVQELDGERQRIDWLSSSDVAGPAVLSWAQSDLGACLIISAVPGIPATDLSPPDLLEAWPSLVRTVRSLHKLPLADGPFQRRLATMLDRAEDVVTRDAVSPEFLLPEQRQTAPADLLERLRAKVPDRVGQEAEDLVVCHGDACLPNFIVDPDTRQCTGLIDLGRLGIADRYVDLSLLAANSHPAWRTGEEAQRAFHMLFEVYGIAVPDQDRLRFYLHLDPLTWG